MRSIRFFTLLLVFALVAAACSSSSDDTTTTAAAETETTTTTETAETTTTVPTEHTTTTTEPVTPSNGPLGMVLVYPDGAVNPICGYDGDEFVSPAPFALVKEILGDHDIDVAPFEPVRDPDRYFAPLPTGLNAYVLTSEGPNPIEISALLLEVGIPASPRHLVMPAARWKFGPADEPVTAARKNYVQEPIVDAKGEAVGVVGTVVVIDTGSTPSPPAHAAGNWDGIFTGTDTVAPQPAEPEPSDLNLTFAGHGVFIAGVVQRLMPGANVSIRSAMYDDPTDDPDNGEILDEHSVVADITAAMTAGGELHQGEGGVVNLSLGTYVCDPNQIPLELAVFLGGIAASTENPDADVVFVAAAGNDREGPDGEPFWPAGFADSHLVAAAKHQWDLDAMSNWPADTVAQQNTISAFKASMDALISTPIVIGVGALETGTPEGDKFSNELAATVWAPGTDVVSTYPDWILSNRPEWDADRYGTAPPTGFASWSGTSFAAPFVSAMIAGCRGGSTYRDSMAQFISDPPLVLESPICP